MRRKGVAVLKDKALYIMEYTDKSVFLTGRAGTGKSTLLKEFIVNTQKRVVVLAPTGIAAVNVGGQTIHSFFKFRSSGNGITAAKNELLNHIDTIVLDEVSMVRADILDAMDLALKKSRESYLPFGGVQMIFIGDLYQLPPVVTNKDTHIANDYKSPFFVDAKCMQNYGYEFIELTHIYRQDESQERFKNALNSIRENSNNIDLDLINSRHLAEPKIGSIYLTARRDLADKINTESLEKIKGHLKVFNADVSGEFKENEYPNDTELKLKVNAPIILINNDKEGRWANGTIAIIALITNNSILAKTSNGENIQIERHTWQKYEYYLNDNQELKYRSIGKFIQFPVRLAAAMTIHKSQGQTFENVIIDTGKGAFAHGQIYVALSRCKSLEGVTLKQKIRKQDVIVDKRIIEFYEKIRICSR